MRSIACELSSGEHFKVHRSTGTQREPYRSRESPSEFSHFLPGPLFGRSGWGTANMSRSASDCWSYACLALVHIRSHFAVHLAWIRELGSAVQTKGSGRVGAAIKGGAKARLDDRCRSGSI